MNNLRDAFVKAGLVSRELADKVEKEKLEQITSRQEKPRESKRQQNIDTLTLGQMLIPIVDGIIKTTPRTYRQLVCEICGDEGSTRFDVIAAHDEMIKERGFSFMLNKEEHEDAMKWFREKVGVIIDPIEVKTADGKVFKTYLCVRCLKAMNELGVVRSLEN